VRCLSFKELSDSRLTSRYFLTFTVSCVACCYILIASSFYKVFKIWRESHEPFHESAKHTWVGIFLASIVFVIGLFPTCLLGLHIVLGLRGQTTREFVSEFDYTLSRN
jgi:uncharacterized membrane protein